MSERDPRVDLSDELLPEHAVAAVQALDHVGVVIVPGGSPAAALTAAAALVLLARTHAHVDVYGDAALPHNPWGVVTLSELLTSLAAVRPIAQAEPECTLTISTGTAPGADRYIAPAAWTVSVTDTPSALADNPADGIEMAVAPYGGMFAAAIVAADLFCDALAPLGLPVAPRRPTFVWNLLDYTYESAPASKLGPPVWAPVLFGGCGSVGSSAAAALACDDLTGMNAVAVDGDDFDPVRNTFRYPAATNRMARTAKASWVSDILAAAGATTDHLVGPIRNWTTSQPAPGFDGIVVSSVDDVDGRYEVADLLARTTLSAAVRALSFHIQREHLGDGLRCPFCDFVTAASPLAQAAADAKLTGLGEQRIVELLHNDTGLEQQDINEMLSAGKLTPETAQGLLGARLADLRNRLYAQAAIPAADPNAAPPAPLSAPFVSWAVGVLLAAEVAKYARGLASVNRRVEVDLLGYPGDFVHIRPADTTGRCACARAIRTRWMHALYPDAFTRTAS
ncbi:MULTISPECIES: hypothetical protein [Kribbella]|uniref:Uncharacterized protein n=2 Tax=Kribbella TaxID=182639 RepID=A0A4R0IHM9_9ACTN|nr:MULTISPECIES: hypothetical protein [Kribbella]TCC30518.1 hypothetical protein E0H50_24225 [Kribbella sindirgiensis]TCC33226.1 hypothetical protein E0H92_34340 [Kribbella speibonae]